MAKIMLLASCLMATAIVPVFEQSDGYKDLDARYEIAGKNIDSRIRLGVHERRQVVETDITIVSS